eukprot:TRINITY_DN21201_c0_g1_i1.p1 TRINITY_DN21201_c0_g1~~TRINITY_DN21201_c0_g1_i1.p1  ORF type:complete len:253 (-),score=22.97 TRINITY_DN21201_c0_g1_i1:180-938(-)
MHNWLPLDFYCNVCMSIGTSTMLSGLSYYALYYQNCVNSLFTTATFREKHGGTLGFIFLTLLTVGTTVADLDLPWRYFAILLFVALGAPAIVTFLLLSDWHMTLLWYIIVLMFNASWILVLCSFALPYRGDTVRRWWSAARYIDILHSTQNDELLGDEWSVVDPIDSDSDDMVPVKSTGNRGWTTEDSWFLAYYGGPRIRSLKSYEAQFKGNNTFFELPGRRFVGQTLMVFVLWILVIIEHSVAYAWGIQLM